MTEGNGENGAESAADRKRRVLERAEAWEREMMTRHGWFAHFVHGDEEQSPTGYNFHTHGFDITYGHPDVQIVVSMPPRTANAILFGIADLLKAGTRLEPGRRYAEILEDFYVEFAPASEGGRQVLRAILPDKSGETARDKIKAPFAVQWKGTL